MTPTFLLISLALSLLLPMAVLLRAPRNPAGQALGAAAALALIWALVPLDLRSPGIRIVSITRDRMFPDTYHVAAIGRWLALVSAAYLAVSAALWAQFCWLPNRAATATVAALWLFHFGVPAIVFADIALGFQGVPRRYLDYEATTAPRQTLAEIGAMTGLLGLAALTLLFLRALVRRLRQA